jgi:hypothetical protein
VKAPDDGDGFITQEESEQNFDVLEKRARKAAMDARESSRLLAKGQGLTLVYFSAQLERF